MHTPEFLTVASPGAPPDILLLFAALRAVLRKLHLCPHRKLLEVRTIAYVKIWGDPCQQFVFDFIKITAKNSFFLSVTGGFD